MKVLQWFIICIVFVFISGVVNAEEVDDRIVELQRKISELKGKENTLIKEKTLLDSQISITNLRIDSTKDTIGRLTLEIDELTNEIGRIEELLTKRSELVLRRIPESYKRKVTPQFGAIFFSNNFSDLISRVKYLSNVQEQDVQLLFQLKATQGHFGERKDLREHKKVEQEQLKKDLEVHTVELEVQKKTKDTLLAQTRNDEAVYQRLLAQALAERQALERALVEGVKVGPIKKGEPIALVGNSGYPGCSTGAHLHFEVRKNNVWQDPGSYLTTRTIQDEQNGGTRSLGSGSWDWPLADTIRITQHFGKTPYSWRYSYSGGIHTGYDMVSTSSEVIKAPADGTLFSSSQGCGGSSVIKIKYIEHGDGIISFYLHVK